MTFWLGGCAFVVFLLLRLCRPVRARLRRMG